jgi:hypothetical protein
MRAVAGLSLSVLAAALAGCATPPPADPLRAEPSATPHASVSPTAVRDAAENAHRARAEADAREGRLADALVQWEILALLRPDVQEYQDEMDRTRRQIRDRTASLLQAASDARRRGNLDQAAMNYLRVLSIDRTHAAAAESLREIERERTRRVYLNRPPRFYPPL